MYNLIGSFEEINNGWLYQWYSAPKYRDTNVKKLCHKHKPLYLITNKLWSSVILPNRQSSTKSRIRTTEKIHFLTCTYGCLSSGGSQHHHHDSISFYTIHWRLSLLIGFNLETMAANHCETELEVSLTHRASPKIIWFVIWRIVS